MGDTAEARFYATEYYRAGILEKTSNEVGVRERGPVGAPVIYTAGGIVVALTRAARCGPVGHHRVDTAAGDAPEEPWLAEAGYISA